jgi:hypothetical protein
MKKAGMRALVVLAWIGCLPGAILGQTVELEPNGQAAQATDILANQPVVGGLFSEGDRDFYRLTLDQEQEVSLSITTTPRQQFAEMVIEIGVFNQQLQQIGGFTSEVASSIDTKIIAGPGEILFSVSKKESGFYFEGSLQYTLTAIVTDVLNPGSVEVEPNGISTLATLLTPNRRMQGGFFSETDTDFYRLSLDEEQEITLTLTTSERQQFAEMIIEVGLFNERQQQVGGFTSEISSGVDTKIISGPGDVFISVKKKASGFYFEGSLKYFLTATLTDVLLPGLVEIEPNDQAVQATDLTPSQSIRGGFFSESDVDYYRLTLDEEKEVTIYLATTPRERFAEMIVQVAIFDQLQQQVGGFTSEVASEVNTKIIAGPGEIYVSIQKKESGFYFEGSLKYTLTATLTDRQGDGLVEIEPNNQSFQATDLSAGQPIQGGFSTEADQDFYRLSLDEEKEVALLLSSTPREQFAEMIIEVGVFDEFRQQIGGFTSKVASSVDTRIIAGPGEVFVSVKKKESGFYFEGSLKYSLTAIVTDVGAAGIVEVEPNNQTTQATLLTPNQPIQGGFFNETDADYYRLSLADQREMTLSLSTTSRVRFAEMNVEVGIFNQDRQQIGGFSSEVASVVETRAIVGPGEVFILVKKQPSGFYYEGSLKYFLTATIEGDIAPVNQPPSMDAVESVSVLAGESISFALVATDEDGDNLTFTMDPDLVGASITENIFLWQPAADQIGIYQITFSVDDGNGETDARTATITVIAPNRSPEFAAIEDQSIQVGELFQLRLSAIDPDDDTLTYEVLSAPTGAFLTEGLFAWEPVTTQAGEYDVTFVARDGRGESDSLRVTLTVLRGNRLPSLAQVGDQSIAVGDTLRIILDASDPEGSALEFGVSPRQEGANLTENQFSWIPTAAQIGSVDLIFTVRDERGGVSDQEVTITVLAVNEAPQFVEIPTQEVHVDSTLQFVLRATDTDGSSLTYDAVSLPVGSTLEDSLFTWRPGEEQEGTAVAEFVVTDGKGAADTLVVIVDVVSTERPEPTAVSFRLLPVVPRANEPFIVEVFSEFSDGARITDSTVSLSGDSIYIDLETSFTDENETVRSTVLEVDGIEAGNYRLIIRANANQVFSEEVYVRDESASAGVFTIDFDLADGDQGVTTGKGAVPGKTYLVELHVKNVGLQFSGWSGIIKFDPGQVEYVTGSFAASDLIPDLVALEDTKRSRLSLGGAILGSGEATEEGGLLGTFEVRLIEGFEEESAIYIVENNLRFVGDESQKYITFFEAVLSSEAVVQGDFNNDGAVDFTDFFAFADAIGGQDARFDLDGSGDVDFTDFFLFADNFGREERGKLIALAQNIIGLPAPTVLRQNNPNPFNHSTNIPFHIALGGSVRLSVYNIVGQKVRTLVDQYLDPGQYAEFWDGRTDEGRLAGSGVYIYRLQMDGHIHSRRLTLIQ